MVLYANFLSVCQLRTLIDSVENWL